MSSVTDSDSLGDDDNTKCRVKFLRRFVGHSSSVLCLVCFQMGTTSRLASGSIDKTVKIWDGESGALLKSLTMHTKTVKHFLKWDEEDKTFLSCARDGKIFLVSVKEMESLRCVYNCVDEGRNELVQMMKIPGDETKLLVIRQSHKDIIMVDFKTGNEIKKMSYGSHENFRFIDWSKLIASKRYPNTFFTNCGGPFQNKYVRQFNYETGRIVREYSMEKELYSVASYINPQDEEIVIGGGTSSKLCFFNPSLEIDKPFKEYPLEYSIQSLSILNERYLFVGGSGSGRLSIFDLLRRDPKIDQPITKLYDGNVHDSGSLNDISLFVSGMSVIMFTCSYNEKTNLSIVKGLVTSDYDVKDLKERLDYLFLEYVDFVEEEGEERVRSCVLEVNFNEASFCRIFKSLFLL